MKRISLFALLTAVLLSPLASFAKSKNTLYIKEVVVRYPVVYYKPMNVEGEPLRCENKRKIKKVIKEIERLAPKNITVKEVFSVTQN